MAGPGRPGRPKGSGPAPSVRGRGRPSGRPRQRRDSNSTVASVDASRIQYLPETSVLKKTKVLDSDSWPCFVLKDAVVYRKAEDGQLQIANVCNVDLEGPFIIRGILEIDPLEQTQYRTPLHACSSWRSGVPKLTSPQCAIVASNLHTLRFRPVSVTLLGTDPGPQYGQPGGQAGLSSTLPPNMPPCMTPFAKAYHSIT